jgi:hypothetical protein
MSKFALDQLSNGDSRNEFGVFPFHEEIRIAFRFEPINISCVRKDIGRPRKENIHKNNNLNRVVVEQNKRTHLKV